MTSSLVGSEMCIRDREQSTGIAEVAGGKVLFTFPTTYYIRIPRYHLPVSYTHLTLPTICSV
eukprot:4127540-Prorocentrum_lima.AAC.1